MRMILVLTVLSVAGCASQPSSPPSTPSVAPPPAAAAAAPAAPALTNDQLLADAKKQGYTVVNQNGEEMVCRTQVRVGSRLQKDTTCLTPAEYDQLRRRTQEGLANTFYSRPSVATK